MSTPIPFRPGEQEALAEAFIRQRLQLAYRPLDHPERLDPEDILAVHYADAGAQGDPGAVWILVRTPEGVGILGGNYAYDDLDLDAVIEKLPMLRCLDTRNAFTPPFPFGGRLDLPPGWGYLYMGAMNHFFARDEVCQRTGKLVGIIHRYSPLDIFFAVAWACGAETEDASDPPEE